MQKFWGLTLACSFAVMRRASERGRYVSLHFRTGAYIYGCTKKPLAARAFAERIPLALKARDKPAQGKRSAALGSRASPMPSALKGRNRQRIRSALSRAFSADHSATPSLTQGGASLALGWLVCALQAAPSGRRHVAQARQALESSMHSRLWPNQRPQNYSLACSLAVL